MNKHQHALRLVTIALVSSLNLGFGLYAGQMPLLLSGVAGMGYAIAATTLGLCRSTELADAVAGA